MRQEREKHFQKEEQERLERKKVAASGAEAGAPGALGRPAGGPGPPENSGVPRVPHGREPLPGLRTPSEEVAVCISAFPKNSDFPFMVVEGSSNFLE